MTERPRAAAVAPALAVVLQEAQAALLAGRASVAVALLEGAEHTFRLEPRLQRLLESAYLASGHPLEAAAAQVAAGALESGEPLLLFNLATGYFQHGHSAAEKWYRVALLMSPGMAVAHQNLAALLRNRGDWAEADRHVELAYQHQWIFVEYAKAPVARVLLACAGGLGNVPTDTLLPAQRFSLIKCMVDYRRDASDAPPQGDVVFNAVGDPDCFTATRPALGQFLESSGLAVLNPPARVLGTRRDYLQATLAMLDRVLVPDVVRIEISTPDEHVEQLLQHFLAAGPLIMRCAESHGGDSVALVNDKVTLNDWLTGVRAGRARRALYATRFADVRTGDRNFRKYRVIFVGGKPYPYHLAISSHWMVHYFSANMADSTEKLDEERRFLEYPEQALGAAAWHALSAIGARLALDYCGIDFAVDGEGRVLVYEANATMMIHHESEDGPLAYKNRFVDAIVAAFENLVLNACNITGVQHVT